jgi:predicted nucleotidyltransferase
MTNNLINKIILKNISGSQLYGTNTPDSDQDYNGIFMPAEQYIFGLLRLTEESEDGTVIKKDENNKNTKDSVDIKLFEIRKFINLALKCNPNILEMLFINDKNIIKSSQEYKTIKKNYNKFLSKKSIYKRFGEYAKTQRHKMVIKLEHYNLYKEFENEYNTLIKENENYKDELISLLIERKLINNLKIKKDNIEFADTHFTKSHTLYKCYKQIKEKLNKITNRKELISKYGYDTKFASHYIRLLLEGIELLETGKLEFPLKYADKIKQIKSGGYSLNEILKEGENIEKKLNTSYENSKVRDHADFDFLNNMTIKILKNHYCKENKNEN